MARKKSHPIEEEMLEEVVEIEEEIIEEPTEEIIEEPIEEVKEEVNSDQFFFTQLKMINKLNNPAKAKRLSDRVLRNRKR